MNATELLSMYERVADSPDALGKLRKFVLDLAVRGKLVEQDAGDESAKAAVQAERYMATPGTAPAHAGAKGAAREGPAFAAPAGWCWTTLGEASTKISDGTHKTPQYVESGIPFVSVKDFSAGRLSLASTRFISVEEHKQLYKRCDPRRGDLLIGRIGTIGRAVLVETDVEFSLFVSVGLIRFNHDQIVPHYFRLLLNSPLVTSEFDRIKVGGGTHTNKLNLGDLHTVRIPLPPFAEQHRIVAKVDELMALCDRLEAARAEREAARDRLAAASLARLNAPAPDTFQSDARFALNVLPALSARPEQVKQLRQTILNLAVRGKLVPQDPSEEPAVKMLARLTPSASGMESSSREVPFNVPSGWIWVTMRHLVLHADAGWSPKTQDSPRIGNSWGVLKVSAVSWGEFRASENKEVLPGTQPRLQAQVQRGDFLISRANTAELVARSVIVEEDPVNLMMSDKIVRLRLSPAVNPQFVCLVNNSANYAREHYARLASGVSPSMKNVSRDVILDLPVPLPPAGEQKRIVEKAGELMTLCDQLNSSLTAGDSTRSRLLGALLHEAIERPAPAAV